MTRNHSSDLLLVLLATVAGAALAFAPIFNNPIRILLTLPLVLLLPGYALMAAIFPNSFLGFLERLTFIFGLSLAVAVLGGLGLNWTPWGMQTSSWVILLSGITFTAVIVALIRRRQYPIVYHPRLNLNGGQILLFGLAVLLVVAGLVVASIGAVQQRTPGFTQLWMLPGKVPNSNILLLGVSNYEGAVVSYRLELKAGGSKIKTWNLIELQPGEKWRAQVHLSDAGEKASTLEAVLYRLDTPESVYRRVTLWRDNE